MAQNIFTYRHRSYSSADIKQALKKAGLKRGDDLFVHSELKSFGKINPKVSRDQFLSSFLTPLLTSVGKTGTVIMPTFSYSYCNNEIFDVKNTPSHVGILSEYFRTRPHVKRSLDPIFSSAAIGPKSNYYTHVGTDCFGKASIFEKLHQKNTKIVFIGETFDITFLHYIEQKFGVPYRFIKIFSGKTRRKNILKRRKYSYNVRPLDNSVIYDLERVGDYLIKKGVVKTVKLGNSKIRVVTAQDAFDNITSAFHQNVFQFLKNPPPQKSTGEEMYTLINQLFPICRSITGNGIRQTLKILQNHIPLNLHEVPSGTRVFDWKVPPEWNIKDAYILDPAGNKIIDFQKNNLHVVGYSTPVNTSLTLAELLPHLYSLPSQPTAIPYITSYYQPRWGFCLTHNQLIRLKPGKYKVVIDSSLKKGSLTYGELVLPGQSKQEIFLSTYACHPSMANNELSGLVVTTYLTKWLLSQPHRFTYRIIFIPETIGSLTYLSKNLKAMQKNIIAGFNITCVGDNRCYSYLPTKNGSTYTDRVALNILSFKHPQFIKWSYLDRGSDERQYNSPGIDLPIGSIMRSKFGTYPQYHTSLDDLTFVNPDGLAGSLEVYQDCLTLIENDYAYKIDCLGEPCLGKRGLYPTLSTKSSRQETKTLMDFIAFADGKHDLIDISQTLKVPVWDLYPFINKLKAAKLLNF